MSDLMVRNWLICASNKILNGNNWSSVLCKVGKSCYRWFHRQNTKASRGELRRLIKSLRIGKCQQLGKSFCYWNKRLFIYKNSFAGNTCVYNYRVISSSATQQCHSDFSSASLNSSNNTNPYHKRKESKSISTR